MPPLRKSEKKEMGIYLKANTTGLNCNVLMAGDYHTMKVDRVKALIHP